MPLLPSYIHIVNPKLKHIYLSFDDAGELIIKSPNISQKSIEQLLLKKSTWITKSRKKLEDKKGKVLDFKQQTTLYFLGEPHPVKLIFCEKKRTTLHFDGDVFSIFYNTFDSYIFQKHIDNFYKEEAKAYIPNIVRQWAKTMNVSPKRISFRKTKRQWGSCSAKNDLSFNTMMMKLPQDVIQYIIVHELAHITHKHHQKSFWALVGTYLPEYKTQIEELKKYST